MVIRARMAWLLSPLRLWAPELKATPILPLQDIIQRTKLTLPTVTSTMSLLVACDIAREMTGRRRNRLFVYNRYLAILNEGTEVLLGNLGNDRNSRNLI